MLESPREQSQLDKVGRKPPEPMADVCMRELQSYLNGHTNGLPPRPSDRSQRDALNDGYQEPTGAVTVQHLPPGPSGRIDNKNHRVTIYPESMTRDQSAHPNPPTPKKNFYERGLDLLNAVIWWSKKYNPKVDNKQHENKKQERMKKQESNHKRINFLFMMHSLLIKFKTFEENSQ